MKTTMKRGFFLVAAFFCALVATGAMCGEAVEVIGEVAITSDGARTAFFLRMQGCVEWGGNFIRIEAIEPSDKTTVIETGFLWPTDAQGHLLAWGTYGELLSTDGYFLHVVERTWPKGTTFIFMLADRDGAMLGEKT